MIRQLGWGGSPVVIEEAPGSRPVLFLHGFSYDRRLWKPVAALLPPPFAPLLLDLPGFGESPIPTSASPDPQSVLAALDELDLLGPIDMVGHSYGGQVAMAIATQRPERVASITLVGSGLTGYPTPPEWLAYMDRVRTALRDGVGPALEVWRSHPNFGPSGSELRQQLVALTDRYRGWHWTNPELATPLPPLVGELSRVQAPTLVMVGERDTAQAQQMAGAIATGVVGARLVVLPGVGHAAPVENPVRVSSELAEFLSSVQADDQLSPTSEKELP